MALVAFINEFWGCNLGFLKGLYSPPLQLYLADRCPPNLQSINLFASLIQAKNSITFLSLI